MIIMIMLGLLWTDADSYLGPTPSSGIECGFDLTR